MKPLKRKMIDAYYDIKNAEDKLKMAIKELSLAAEIKLLDDQGIIHGIRHNNDLDEAPSSYKPIDVVMANQEDLVKIVHTLTPLAVIKG